MLTGLRVASTVNVVWIICGMDVVICGMDSEDCIGCEISFACVFEFSARSLVNCTNIK